jgi:hypothetical protein
MTLHLKNSLSCYTFLGIFMGTIQMAKVERIRTNHVMDEVRPQMSEKSLSRVTC